jgi:alpha-mannosidase
MISVRKGHVRIPVSLPAFLLLFLFAGYAAAQRGGEFGRAAGALPADSRAIVDRLMGLRELPDGPWKFHAGDLPHGEDPNLDDSTWATMAAGASGPNEAVWFRRIVEVPAALDGYDLTGARIWFQFHADANGPVPQIIYVNGRRVALGDDLEPIVLFDKAHPGDKAMVAVKLLHTVDTKRIGGATLRIDFPESRPNPVDLGEQFLAAAVLAPSLEPGDAAPMATLNSAIRAVDIAALETRNQQAFDASLQAAQRRLEALEPLLSGATFHLDGDAHIDAAWLWPWTETVGVVRNTFSTALQLMYEYPGYTFTQSAAAYNEWMARDYPDLNEQIRQRIREGRWEIVGGMWVEPDLNMPDGESLVRQLLVGKRWYEHEYGVDVRIGWNPDSFGYSWQLPQIYKKSGVDYFVTQKMAWNDTNQLPFKLFWWESPDGSKVLTYFPHDYVNLSLNPVRLSEDLKNGRMYSPGMTELLDLYGVGDHGGGPTRAILDEGFHWKNPGNVAIAANGGKPVTPKYEFGSAQSFFSTVEKEIAPESRTWNYQSIPHYQEPAPVAGRIAIPTWDSELYLEYHRGVFTTQARHKHNMRTAEEELLNAEKWSSLAWLDGAAYPGDQLTEDWKKVLFNQFHDLAAGSGIGVIYKDAQKDYDWVRMSTDGIDANALRTVMANIDTFSDAAIPVVVWNPLGWERSGDVTVTVQSPQGNVGPSWGWSYEGRAKSFRDIREVHVASNDPATGVATVVVRGVRVPAVGYRVIYLYPALRAVEPVRTQRVEPSPAAFVLTSNSGALRVSIDRKSGCITSIESNGVQSLASGACGNQLQFFKDLPKQYDAWNIDPGTLDAAPSVIEKADSVELVDRNSPGPAVRVRYHYQNSTFVQTISLKGDIVDIDSDIDWHESHVLLKAAFPLAVASNFATYEIPYGTIERPTTRNNSWEKAQFEVPALRWADLSGKGPDGRVYGLSLLNKDKYGYDAVGNVLRLTLLRSPKWPDPDADMGHQHFHYAIYPHAGTWKQALTMRRGWEYDYPLQAVVTTAHPGSLPAEHSFASVGPDNVILTAVKKAEDSNALIFRAYEWAGKAATAEFHVPPGAAAATVTNLMEKPEGRPLAIDSNSAGDTIKVPIHPYEILTVRVDYPQGGERKQAAISAQAAKSSDARIR